MASKKLITKPINKTLTNKNPTNKTLTKKPVKPKPIKSKQTIEVYTDGACSGNGKSTAVGGIGIHFPNHELKDVSKIFKVGICTNQRTELYAILCAIRYIKQNIGLKDVGVHIYTDSQYSINCITKWTNGWIKNGWKTKNGTPVLNREFIEVIHKYYEYFDIKFSHVDGHSGDPANDRADELAVMASKKAGQMFQNDYTTDFACDSDYQNETEVEPVKVVKKAPRKIVKPNNYVNGFPKGTDFVVELIKSKN